MIGAYTALVIGIIDAIIQLKLLNYNWQKRRDNKGINY